MTEPEVQESPQQVSTASRTGISLWVARSLIENIAHIHDIRRESRVQIHGRSDWRFVRYWRCRCYEESMPDWSDHAVAT